MSCGLEVTAVRADERAALANMMQLYVHDFSEQWAGTAKGELEPDGRFAPYPLDSYWREPSRIPLFLRSDGHLAGFALINAIAHSGQPVDCSMAEFFVVRKHRRHGFGAAAAQTIFARHPGQWEVAVARANTGALAFWRKTIARMPGVAEMDEFESANAAWDGAIFRFRIAPGAAPPR